MPQICPRFDSGLFDLIIQEKLNGGTNTLIWGIFAIWQKKAGYHGLVQLEVNLVFSDILWYILHAYIYLGLSTNVGEFLRVKIFIIVKILCTDKEIYQQSYIHNTEDQLSRQSQLRR